jgi:hypothetical protein
MLVTEEMGHNPPSRSFHAPEQTGSVMMELPDGRAEVSGARAAEVPSAGITLDLQFCGLGQS